MYALKILQNELNRLTKIDIMLDNNSTNATIDFNILNKINDLKKAIALLYRKQPITMIYN